jgi:hypothetical protein
MSKRLASQRERRGRLKGTRQLRFPFGRSVSGAGLRSEKAELGRLAVDGAMLPEQPGQTKNYFTCSQGVMLRPQAG